MKNFGEFISMDAAVELLTGKDPLDGRYFCLSSDDGLKSCVTSALPILNDLQVPCIFYVVTDYMGKTFEAADQVAHNVFNFTSNNSSLEFMTWDDCRTLMDCNMSIGSHSCSHPKMTDLAPADIGSELAVSKAKIEEYLGGTCRHFCVPYGTPGLHYEPGGNDPACGEGRLRVNGNGGSRFTRHREATPLL